MISIEANDIVVGYEMKVASGEFIFHSGSFVAVIGNNGSGKSTLLKSIACFIPLINGRLLVNNMNSADLTKPEIAKLFSVVNTYSADLPLITVKDLVALGRYPYTNLWGKLCKRDEEIIDDVLEKCGIFSLKQRKMNDLSDGERQKAFIAKSLAQESPVLLLDEPTSFLDLKSKVRLFSLLEKLVSDENKLIFVSTHDLQMAQKHASHFLMLETDKNWVLSTERNEVEYWINSQL